MRTWFWQPSRQLLLARFALIALLCCGVGVSGLLLGNTLWLMLVGVLLLLQGQREWRQRLMAGQRRGLRYSETGWQLWTAQQGWRAIDLLGTSVVVARLIVVYYRHPQHWFSPALVLPRDVLSAEQHRRLRVQLRFARLTPRAAE